tara:strand:+ start:275 stop:829 length:555 start_codon:yes stop_codon:yes gene_type:complete
MKIRALIITPFLLLMVTTLFALAIENQEKASEGSLSHKHEHEEDVDHKNPKNQRRMGIFHYNEGNRLIKKGHLQEAESSYRMALHHDKRLYEVYVNLSTLYMRDKKFSKALKTLNELKFLQPQYPTLHYNLACYFSLLKKTQSSLKSLKKAFELGFNDKHQVESDPDLENLRELSEFAKWLKTL